MPRAELYLRAVSILQGFASLYVLLNAMVAAEMSSLLAVTLGVCAALAAGSAIGIAKGWRNAFRISVVLNVLVVGVGVWLLFLARDAPWLGLAHVLAGLMLLLGLWAGRRAASPAL